MFRRFVAALLTALVVGCSGPVGGSAVPSPSAGADTAGANFSSTAESSSIDRAYDVDGYRLHLTCHGATTDGVPTIVYLHGLGGSGGDWGVL